MAEKPDNVGPVEVKEAEAGPGHNQPKEVVWERWQKKRTFVRALEGTYGELQQGLMDQPRVYKSTDWQWKGGPQFFDKPIINPQRTDIAQSIETHIFMHCSRWNWPAPWAYEFSAVLHHLRKRIRYPRR